MYNEFCKKFEEHIERIINSCNLSVESFFAALKTITDQDPDNSFYVEVLLSVTDFTNFIDMMKHYKKEQATKAE